ncbi:MAG: Uncharacterized protein CEN90_509 [Parcubacteria group bacterium Licking1014_17]|nr:MAG: Uncharacterized protein CEN90_509 [Parcubacteria group bacterium Licking1014_17]
MLFELFTGRYFVRHRLLEWLNKMISKIKSIIKKITPQWAISLYHYSLAVFSAAIYGFPSEKMAVIGVTGTKGKTTTANFIWSCLQAGGYKTGIITTANIRIGEKETLNKYHMTMPGRFVIQKLLRQMVKEGCKYCVVETTSEGIKQHRHRGIHYDIAVFTNLTPEHLPSHGGSFEKYKQAKGKLFESLAKHNHKHVAGKLIEPTIIINNDSEHKDYFLSFRASQKITYGLNQGADYAAENVRDTASGVEFSVKGVMFHLGILGRFNVYNALPAIIICRLFKVPDLLIERGLKNLRLIPGRMELINEGQNFTVIVDYAHEKESITAVLETAQKIIKPGAKIIILLGAEGGGRDKFKRPVMGKLAGEMADYVIASNVDPYEDDPTEIAEDIARAAEEAGKIRNQNLFVIEDRRQGIKKALELAKSGDIVIITGKGAEQSIFIGGKKYDWDDRTVTKEELNKLLSGKK